MSDVFESCMTSPETVILTPRLFGSMPLASAMHGPSGANVSKFLPRMNCPPELRCAVRAETSLKRRDAADRRARSGAVDPARPASDHERQLGLVVGGVVVLGRGSTMSSPGPEYAFGSLQKTIGSDGSAEPVSSACSR